MAKASKVYGINIHASTGDNARQIARARVEDLYSLAVYADNPLYSHELHDMRIAAKRLRYTLEIFEDVLPAQTADVIKEVTQIQEELGALHDSDVMIELLQICLENKEHGMSYDEAVAQTTPDEIHHERVAVNPEMLAYLVNPELAPSAQEHEGLQLLLLSLQQSRKEQYTTFRQHWHQLQGRDFRRALLNLLA